uniref:DUF1968 domain-containing protein n=1 Tax=Panagrellus redivivus TaxID=6233 RepID=A0A7E4VHC1_PANRE
MRLHPVSRNPSHYSIKVYLIYSREALKPDAKVDDEASYRNKKQVEVMFSPNLNKNTFRMDIVLHPDAGYGFLSEDATCYYDLSRSTVERTIVDRDPFQKSKSPTPFIDTYLASSIGFFRRFSHVLCVLVFRVDSVFLSCHKNSGDNVHSAKWTVDDNTDRAPWVLAFTIQCFIAPLGDIASSSGGEGGDIECASSSFLGCVVVCFDGRRHCCQSAGNRRP